jgi:hypothetical protein
MPYMPKKIVLPEPLEAKGKMEPNEPCWCGSGVKWKKCHRDKAQAKPVNYYEALSKFEAEFSAGYCSHPTAPEGCSKGIIRAHTVQKTGVLDAIAEDRHVLSAHGKRRDLQRSKGVLEPQRLGVNDASTFRGFCNTHDTELFLDIEGKDFPVTDRTAFLLTFRAVSLELFQKRAAREALRAFKSKDADAGKSLREQEGIQNYLSDSLTGMDYAMRDLEAWKRDLDKRYGVEEYSGFEMSVTEFDGLLPLVATFAFHPESDFAGTTLQSLGDDKLEQLTFNVLVRDGRSILAVTWIKARGGACEAFMSSFEALPDEDTRPNLCTWCTSRRSLAILHKRQG